MSRRFDIKELMHVAVRDERSGISMYRDLSGSAQLSQVKEMFTWLSDQEKEHEKRFRQIEEMLESYEQPEQYPDEYVDYLEAMVSEGTYSGTDGSDLPDVSDIDLVNSAIRYERDQLSLQKDIGSILSSDYKHIIDEVLNEERDHLVRLSRLKHDLETT
jgi:rubrerythrin